jgi:hypothetical protein
MVMRQEQERLGSVGKQRVKKGAENVLSEESMR